MKKWMLLLLTVLLMFSGCAMQPEEQPGTEAQVRYRVEIIGEYIPENELDDGYFPGDLVNIVLGNVTGHYYTVTVNGAECPVNEEATDRTYEVYTFRMPEEDAHVVIMGHHVDIPTVPPETMPEIQQPEPEDEDFVQVSAYIPEAVTDLRYATEDNFTGQKIYEFEDCWLRYGTVRKLMEVQAELAEAGFRLKIWDGFRPPAAQRKLWDVCPDPKYVSNPNRGFSSHSRGNTVDVTLVYADGTEVEMPTGFDDFSSLADRDYRDCTPEAAENARFLEGRMEKHGFKPYSGEWWHFTDTESYPVEESFRPVAGQWYLADCEEFISLRTKPDTSAEVIIRIPADAKVWVVGWHEDFALVEYENLTGFVLGSYICRSE